MEGWWWMASWRGTCGASSKTLEQCLWMCWSPTQPRIPRTQRRKAAGAGRRCYLLSGSDAEKEQKEEVAFGECSGVCDMNPATQVSSLVCSWCKSMEFNLLAEDTGWKESICPHLPTAHVSTPQCTHPLKKLTPFPVTAEIRCCGANPGCAHPTHVYKVLCFKNDPGQHEPEGKAQNCWIWVPCGPDLGRITLFSCLCLGFLAYLVEAMFGFPSASSLEDGRWQPAQSNRLWIPPCPEEEQSPWALLILRADKLSSSEIQAEETSKRDPLHLLLPQAKHWNSSLLRLRMYTASQPTHWLFSASEPLF